MIATTIISSTSVKPRWFRIFLCQKLNMSVSSSLGLGLWTARAASLQSGRHECTIGARPMETFSSRARNARGTRNCMEMVRSVAGATGTETAGSWWRDPLGRSTR